jgi:hypothetical protein
LAKQPPSTESIKNSKNKCKASATRIVDISRSLLENERVENDETDDSEIFR